MQTKMLEMARRAIRLQQDALEKLEQELGDEFIAAVEKISQARMVYTAGIGKSGFVAAKMASTLRSLRLQGSCLHPVDALHGDIGVVSNSDVVVLISKSGETPEMLTFARALSARGVSMVAISTRRQSTLSSLVDTVLIAPIENEYDELNILPTSSTTQALVLSDLLCVAAGATTGDVRERLMLSHPHGSIGAALTKTVGDVMHAYDVTPHIPIESGINEAIQSLTNYALGIVCITDGQRRLHGVLTDGDIRRWIATSQVTQESPVTEIMTLAPVVVGPEMLILHAIELMENRSHQISALPVVSDGLLVGVVRLHDLVRASL